MKQSCNKKEKNKTNIIFYFGKPFSLQEGMKGKDAMWDKIVKEKGLRPGLKLEDVAHWWFLDI
jgi:hypothetical protein